MRITMLGCGSSSGVPMVGCTCSVCTSDNPRNRRSRVSIVIEEGGKTILIDTSPDLRHQALANNINKINAVVYTHDHADHTHGIDDLRAFNIVKDDALPIYADRDTLALLQSRFGYVFQQKPEPAWFRPCLTPHIIPTEPLADFEVEGINFTPILQTHGKSTSLGFRIGNFAYSTDMNGIPDESWEKFAGLDVWIVDCLRYTHSYTHSRLETTLEWIVRLKPKQAILTHMAHEFDYDRLCKELPVGVIPGYDGLVIDC